MMNKYADVVRPLVGVALAGACAATAPDFLALWLYAVAGGWLASQAWQAFRSL